MKDQRVILSGRSKAFRKNFKELVGQCGLKAVLREEAGEDPSGFDLYIYEAATRGDLKSIAAGKDAGPFLIFTGLALTTADAELLKARGLMGIVTAQTAPEDLSFLINNAFFYDNMVRRNPRAPASLQVNLSMGSRRMSAVSSLLSRDGMFIVTLHPLPVSSVCDLIFTLPGASSAEMKTKAKVLYAISINEDLNIIASPKDPFKRLVTHPGMAVFFIDLPEKERALIDGFVNGAMNKGG